MKVINPDNGFLVYQKIFSNLQANNCRLVLWQNHPVSGERIVSESVVNSFYMESKLIHLDLKKDQLIDKASPLYCYSEDGQLIFKTSVYEIRDGVFSIDMPPEIKFLEDPDRRDIKVKMGVDLTNDVMRVKRLNLGLELPQLGGYMKVKTMAQRSDRDRDFLNTEFGGVSLDEEDKLFADKRESPRARPKADKWVHVRLADSENVHRLKLFDLSQGGMGFVTFDIDHFPKGADIYLVGIDTHELDDPLIGKVMSHRPMDEAQLEWKIGVKFDDGQE